jgi:proteasome lid subunit RPN8/RPN11
MNSLLSGIQLTIAHWEQMKADVASRSAEEACGFVLGEGHAARMVIPVKNIYHDRFKFRMDPQEELDAFILAEQRGWEVLAIYHSHPQGIDRPSNSDLDELTFPGVVYIIWYQSDSKWQCRAYLMQSQSNSEEVPITISASE